MHRLTRFSLDHPVLALAIIAIVTLALGLGLPRVRTEFGYRVLIGDDYPSIRTLDELIERFGGGLPATIAWGCHDGAPCVSVFDPGSIRMAHEVATELGSRPGVRNVLGPSNAPLIIAASDGFAIRRLVEGGEIAPDLETLKREALDDETWVGNIVSRDGRVGALIVEPIDSDASTDALVTRATLEILAPYEAQGFIFSLVGDPYGNIIGGQELAESTAQLVPFMVLTIAAILYALTLSWLSSLATLLTLGVALVWTYGAMGWLALPRDSVLELLAPLLLIVGVCDAIHFLSRYATLIGSARPLTRSLRRDALLSAAREVGLPCFVTTATTCAAFLSFATSSLDTFRRFGPTAAFGVACCLLLGFSMLPILVHLVPTREASSVRAADAWDSVLRATIRTSRARPGPLLITVFAFTLVCTYGWIAHLEVDTSREELFGENSRILTWSNFVQEHLRPSYTLEIDVALPPSAALPEPETLAALEHFTSGLDALDRAGTSSSVIELMTRTHRALRGGDRTFAMRSATLAGNAEALELIAFESPDLLRSWVSFDQSRVRISLDVPEQPYSSAVELSRQVEDVARRTLPTDWVVTQSGSVALNIDWVREIQATQARSLPTAFLLVLGMLAIFLRSLPLALLGMLPTLLPVVAVLGAMGFSGLGLDVGRAMIAAIVIGIAVDDSIHLLHAYRAECARGRSPADSIDAALMRTGRALVTTSLALSVGFLALMASAWGTISSFGFFVSISVLSALAAVIFVVPSLIFIWNDRAAR